MSDLPDGWEEIHFGELNSFSSRTINPADSPDELFELYSVPSYPSGMPETQLGRNIGSTKQQVEPADVLVCKINPRINRVWQVRPKQTARQIASSEWIVMRAPEVDPRFLKYFFGSGEFREVICQDVTGVGGSLTRAQPKRVAMFKIPIAPINEQKRIADKLDANVARVDACRERLDRVPAILKRFRQSVLATAISGGLTEEWREGLSFTSGTRSSAGLFDVPEGWGWETTGVVADVKGGKRLPKGEKLVNYDTGFPYIKAGQLKNGTVEKEGQEYLTPSVQRKIQRYIVEQGDVYITIVGACIGDSGVIPPEYDKANLTENAAKICNLRGVLSDYLAYWLRSPAAQEHINFLVKSGAQGKLALMRIKDIPIPLPAIREQQEIVRRVDSLFIYTDRLEARYTAACVHVERVTQALLAKAFRGELVPQDPHDEPASVLLERIRAARAAAPDKPMRHMVVSVTRKSVTVEDLMLTRKDISGTHLTTILKDRGPLTAEALWSASQLDIDDFYDQLKDEETRGLLKEQRGDSATTPRILLAAA